MTATWKGVQVPDDFWNAIIGGAYGRPDHAQIPPALLCAISYAETGMRNIQSEVPVADGPNGCEDSWGYLQLYRQGVGYGYSSDVLLDPSSNVFLARNHIIKQIHAGFGWPHAIGAWSTAQQAWNDYLDCPLVEIS